MRLIRLLLAATAFVISATAGAAPAEPKNGVDYVTLDAPQRADTGKKVEVTEFFMYSCPHCNSLDPVLRDWVKKQGDNIVFRRVHLAFSGPNDPQAHMFVTLEAMGQLEALHDKIFRAIHAERNRLNTDAATLDFVVQHGVDKAKYLEYFNSFAVQTKLKRAAQLQTAFKIDSAPTLIVDGQYKTSPSMVSRPGQPELQAQLATLQVLDALVAKVQKANGAGMAAAKK